MVKQKLRLTKLKQKLIVISLMAVLSFGFFAAPFASGQNFQQQINQLQAQNAANDEAVEKLEDQATSYQDAIAKLEAKISHLQAKIDANKAEQARLKREIAAAEIELAKQKETLGQNIKSMYLEGDISTLEMLATSKDLSDFVDKEQYRKTVQDKIKDTLDKVNALRLELKTKKNAVDALLKDQLAQQATLSSSRQEQHRLLSMNQSQIDNFNHQTEKNRQKIEELVAAQIAANQTLSGGVYFLRFPGGAGGFNAGNYPYRNAGFGMSPGPGCVDNDGPDPWGYCTRQCVSFAAWAVKASGRTPPMYYGNARDWVAAAYAHGIPVYRSPQPGDVAISTSGNWGHAMYVQSVSGNTFYSLEYNGGLNGQPSHQWRAWN
jgi:peptidoglycan DL-endopeptidase CwlO